MTMIVPFVIVIFMPLISAILTFFLDLKKHRKYFSRTEKITKIGPWVTNTKIQVIFYTE